VEMPPEEGGIFKSFAPPVKLSRRDGGGGCARR
jgi:hypothetical protein